MTFTKEELAIISLALPLYRDKVNKLMKDTQKIKTAEKVVKAAFLETEALINKIQTQ